MDAPLVHFQYMRKSLEDRKRQFLSLPAQKGELQRIKNVHRLDVLEMLEESRTAKIPGRPIFNEMLDRIERGEANAILVWDIDRLYRNPIDEGRVRWMLQQGIIRSIRTPTREYGPTDAGLLMAVEGGRAIEHILSFARNLKKTHDEKLRQGKWPGQAIYGFVFDPIIRNLAPHPHQSKVMLQIYEEFSMGRMGLHATSLRAYELGMKAKDGDPLSNSEIYKRLTNRLYMGIMVWKGQVHEGKYVPIVSAELFGKVQQVLKVRSKPRRSRGGHNFPFCGVFRCSCGSMISAQWGRGNGGSYRYYRCTKKSPVLCAEPYIREERVLAQCLEKVKALAISNDEATSLRAVIDGQAEDCAQSVKAALRSNDESLTPLENEMKRLTRVLLKEQIDEETYAQMREELVVEKMKLKHERKRLLTSRQDAWVEPARRLVRTLETLGKKETSQNLHEISTLLRIIGTNHRISQKSVAFTFAADYDFAASVLGSVRSNQSHQPLSACTPIQTSSIWCTVVELMRTHFSAGLPPGGASAT